MTCDGAGRERGPMSSRYCRSVLCGLVLLLAGCTSYVIPDGRALPTNPVTPSFTGAGALAIVTLEVESGDREIKRYTGNIASSIGLRKTANGAVMKAVAAALNSDQLKTYLNR